MNPDGGVPAFSARLPDGTPVRLRPVGPGDREALRRGVAHDLSAESRYRRFLSPLRELSEEQLDELTGADGVDHCALGALAGVRGRPAGVARYIRSAARPEQAEVALTVADAWQRRGLGTLLLAALGTLALDNGVRVFHADLLSDNLPVLALLRRCGDAASMHSLDGVVEARLELEPLAPLLAGLLGSGLNAGTGRPV
jgi:GNAT superfamily N-acetyltransferase